MLLRSVRRTGFDGDSVSTSVTLAERSPGLRYTNRALAQPWSLRRRCRRRSARRRVPGRVGQRSTAVRSRRPAPGRSSVRMRGRLASHMRCSYVFRAHGGDTVAAIAPDSGDTGVRTNAGPGVGSARGVPYSSPRSGTAVALAGTPPAGNHHRATTLSDATTKLPVSERSGHRGDVTARGVKQQRAAAEEPAHHSHAPKRYLCRSAMLHAAPRALQSPKRRTASNSQFASLRAPLRRHCTSLARRPTQDALCTARRARRSEAVAHAISCVHATSSSTDAKATVLAAMARRSQ